jgi:hypothetical protein
MSKQQYFYLISGLPDLAITDTYLAFTAKVFLDELKNKIDQKDFELVCWLYYIKDNSNLINILFNENPSKQQEGYYSLLELKKALEGNTALPHYMNDFIASVTENKSQFTKVEWETKLTVAYFGEAMKSGNEFLNQWMEFELNLKNLLLIMSNKKEQLPFSEFIIEANEMAALFKQSPSADFSTESSLGFLAQVIKIIETENIIEREKKIDLLRWKQLEEMTFFNYFTVEVILSFIIKLMILERWAILKQEQVKISLATILNSFMEKIEMPEFKNA